MGVYAGIIQVCNTQYCQGKRRVDRRFPGNLRAPIPAFPQRGKEQNGHGYRGPHGELSSYVLSIKKAFYAIRTGVSSY